MRPSFLAALLILASVPAASAQDDACTQASPCDWVVDVDAVGFSEAPADGWNFTVGDWFVLDAFNFDDTVHHVTVQAAGVTLTVDPLTDARSAPFRFTAAGSSSLTDTPSGDAVPVHVYAGDVVAMEEGETATDGASEDSPALALLWGGLALAGLAVLRRR